MENQYIIVRNCTCYTKREFFRLFQEILMMIYATFKLCIKKRKDHPLWCMDDYVFDKSIFYYYPTFRALYYTHCQGTVLQQKIIFFTSISKIVITYITIAVTNISNNTIKQYYGIIKTFKVLVIVKKKQFSRTNILI